jgi:hypothetical protein
MQSMTENVENLVLEHLRALRADISDVRRTQKEHTTRLGEIAGSVAAVRRDQAHDGEVAAHLAVRIDPLDEEIQRIKRRLELTD